MADEVEATIRINADMDSISGKLSDLLGQFESIKSAVSGTTDKISSFEGQSVSAYDNVGAAVKEQTDIVIASSEKQQQIIAELQAKFTDSALARTAIVQEVSEKEIALRLAVLSNEQEAGRLSVSAHQEALGQLLSSTEANTKARIAVERSYHEAVRQGVLQDIAVTRGEVEAGNISRSTQIGFLRSIANETEYNTRTRQEATKELGRVEIQVAKEAADAVKTAEQEKAQATKESARIATEATKEAAQAQHAHNTELHEGKKASMEFGYGMMDVGYALEGVGIKSGGLLGDIGYIARDFSSLTPMMLVGLAALAVAWGTLAGSVELASKAVQNASKDELELVSLTALIKNQGGAYQKLSKEAEDYARSISLAFGTSKTEVVGGMQQMLAAGVSANDMLRSQQAALDLAAAKNITLKQAEEELAAAYDGRLLAFKRLGLVTKEEVKNGLLYEELLKRIETRMGGTAAAAADIYIGKQKEITATVYDLTKQIGDALLPILSNLADSFNDALKSLQPLVNQFKKFINDDAPKIQTALDNIGKLFSSIASVSIPAMLHGVEAAISGLVQFSGWVEQHRNEIATFFDTVIRVGVVAAMVAAMTATWAAVAAMDAFLASTTLATGGVNIALGAMALELVALSQNWDENLTNMTSWWTDFQNNVSSGVTFVLDQLDRMIRGFADAVRQLPVVGNAIAGAMDDIAFQVHVQADGSRVPDKSYKGKPDPYTMKHGGGFDDAENGWSFGDWGSPQKKPTVPQTNPSIHEIAGTANAPKPKHTKQGYDPTSIDIADDRATDVPRKYSNDVTEKIEKQKNALKDLENWSKLATTAQESHNRMLAVAKGKIDEALAETMLYSRAQADDNKEQKAAGEAYLGSISTLRQAKEAQREFADSLKGKTTLTVADKDEQKRLAEAVKDANKQEQDAKRYLDEVNASYNKHHDALKIAIRLTTDLGVAQQAIGAAEAIRADKFDRKEKERLAEREATEGKTNKQKIEIYTDMYNQLDKLDEDYEANRERLIVLIHDATIASEIDILKAKKKIHDEELKMVNSLLDDIVIKHKSFKDILKTVYDDILKNFISMVSKMIVESALFKNVFNNLGAGDVGGGGGGGFLGFFSKLFNHGGGCSTSASTNAGFTLDSGMQAATSSSGLDLSPSTISKITGSPNGVSPFQSMSNFLGRGISGPGSATYGGVGLAMAGGGILGSAIGGMMNNGQNYGMQGGSLGGGLGAILGVHAFASMGAFAGPVGAIAGAVLGSILGSVFGSHDKPANMPDKYDTTRYVGIISNLLGHAGANGVEQDQDPTLKALFNGKSGIAAVESTLAQYGSKDKAPDWLKPMFDEMKGLFGISATGSGKLNFGHAINNEHITGASGVDGQIHQYTEYGTALAKFAQAYSQNPPATAAAIAQIFQVDRMAPDFNNARVSNFHGGDGGIHSVASGIHAPPISISGPRSFGGGTAFSGPVTHGKIGQGSYHGEKPNQYTGQAINMMGGGPGSGANFHNNNGIHPITINVQNLVGTDGMTQLAERLSIIRTQNSFHGRFNRNQDEY